MAIGRKTGGRQKGSVNKIKIEPATRLAIVHAAVTAAKEASGTPLEYFVQIMQDPKHYEPRRFEAAKAAAPFMHAKMVQAELSGPHGGAIPISVSDADRVQALMALIAKLKPKDAS
jgi:hypothetical protein